MNLLNHAQCSFICIAPVTETHVKRQKTTKPSLYSVNKTKRRPMCAWIAPQHLLKTRYRKMHWIDTHVIRSGITAGTFARTGTSQIFSHDKHSRKHICASR